MSQSKNLSDTHACSPKAGTHSKSVNNYAKGDTPVSAAKRVVGERTTAWKKSASRSRSGRETEGRGMKLARD